MYRRKPGGNWYISVGGTRQTAGTKDREKARQLEHKLNQEAWDRRHGLVAPTWDQACLSWIGDNPRQAETYENLKYLCWWKPFLSGKKLTAIDPKLVHKIISENRVVDLHARISENATANGYVSFVGRVIRHGSNLAPKFIHYPAIRFRERWLRIEEWLALSPYLNPDEIDIFTYALATGQREANCMFLEWGWIDGAAVLIPATETKTRVPYGIPLNQVARSVLDRRRQGAVKHLAYVFTNRGKPWYRVALLRALARACRKAGIEPITVHGLRHTFNTWLARAGVAKEVRKRLLGHSGGDVHDGYTHFDVDSLLPWACKIDEILSRNIDLSTKSAVG